MMFMELNCCWLTAALAMTLAAVLWRVSTTCRYYGKFALFILISLVWATVPIPFMLLRPRDPRNALLPAWGLRQFAWLLGLNFKVRGLQNIVKDSKSQGTGCVVVINHQSALDLIVLAELWPIMPRCTVISKREVFWLWPFGLATWLWGTVFIDRRDVDSARSKVNAAGEAIQSRGARVLMFPEGTRHPGPDLLPFKKGAFHLAIEAQCPIQPVIVSNYYFLEGNTKRFESGEAIVSILPAIETVGLGKEDLPKLVNRVQHTMGQAYQTLSGEAQTLNNNTHHKQY